MTRRRSGPGRSKADGFSIVTRGVSSRVKPAALTMRGSPANAATASISACRSRGSLLLSEPDGAQASTETTNSEAVDSKATARPDETMVSPALTVLPLGR